MQKHHSFRNVLLLSSILGAGFLVAPLSSSYAAFEWTPPAAPAPQGQAASPVEEVEQSAIPEVSANGNDMVLRVPANSELAQDLETLIQQAEDKNVLTPTAEIPEEEKVDTVVNEDVTDIVMMPEQSDEETPTIEAMTTVVHEELKAEEVTEPMPIAAPEIVAEVKTPEAKPEEKEMISEVKSAADSPKAEVVDVVRGFGKDLPLIMAVRQIIPARTVYSFGEGVDLGVLVSWEGGQTWQDTLSALAERNNMSVKFMDDQVRLSKKEETSAPATLVKQEPVVEIIEEVAVIETEAEDTPEAIEEDLVAMLDPTVNAASQKSDIDAVLENSMSDAVPSSEIVQPAVQQDMPLLPNMDEGTVVAQVADETVEMIPEPAQDAVELTEKIVLIEEPTSDISPQIDALVESNVTEISEPMPLSDSTAQQVFESNEASPEDLAMVETASRSDTFKQYGLNTVKTWKVKKNSDLKTTLEQWTKENGVALDWQMSQDYPVSYMVWVDGDFEEAVETLMQGYKNDPGIIPHATFEMKEGAGPVLIIEPAA